MKIFAAIFLALALLSAPLHAQTIEQKLTTLLAQPTPTQEKIYAVHDMLQVASDTRASLKAEGAKALAKLADINQQNANYTAAVTKHNNEAIAHDQRYAIHDGQTQAHNANQCTYYNGRTQDCAAYNAEQDRLNAEGAAIDRERDQINQEKETLEAAGQGLQLEIDDFNKYKDDFNARNNANEHNIDVLMRVLKMLQKTTASCQDVLQNPATTPEQLHAACGEGFDGNNNQAPLTHSGTGGASQNK